MTCLNYLISQSHGQSKHCLWCKHSKCANITCSVKVYYDFTIVIFMKWSPNAGKICCLGWFWVVAGRVGQVALETRLILMEKTLGGN